MFLQLESWNLQERDFRTVSMLGPKITKIAQKVSEQWDFKDLVVKLDFFLSGTKTPFVLQLDVWNFQDGNF